MFGVISIIIIERIDLGGVSDAIVGRAVEVRKTSDEQFRLQLTSKGCQ